MRLVSQNGNVDIPYEQAHILCNMECVMARVGDCEYTLGKYSDKAKTLKVMEMLREYKETKEIKSMLLTKSILESFTNTKIKNFEIHTDGMGDYFKVDIVKKVEYFKFPNDSEVEV